MAIDWPKVMEVFSTGIVGVFVVMIIVQIMTILTTKVVDYVERPNPDIPSAEKKE